MMNITMWTLDHYHIMICNNIQTQIKWIAIKSQIWHDLNSMILWTWIIELKTNPYFALSTLLG